MQPGLPSLGPLQSGQVLTNRHCGCQLMAGGTLSATCLVRKATSAPQMSGPDVAAQPQ